MTTRAKAITTVVLLVGLAGLGITDWLLSKQENGPVNTAQEMSAESISSQLAVMQSSSVGGGGVAKQQQQNVAAMITAAGFTTQAGTDQSMLEQVVSASGTTLHKLTILKDGDRAGAVVWIETGEVKNIFNALKQGLLSAFSPQVQDLSDETHADPGFPVRNILTFLDPSLSQERLTFVRVRERLYEFHIATGKENVMNPLIETVTAQ